MLAKEALYLANKKIVVLIFYDFCLKYLLFQYMFSK
jgi:hypothetical protein